MLTLVLICKKGILCPIFTDFWHQPHTLKGLTKWLQSELHAFSAPPYPEFTLTIHIPFKGAGVGTLFTDIPLNQDFSLLAESVRLRAGILDILKYSEGLSLEEKNPTVEVIQSNLNRTLSSLQTKKEHNKALTCQKEILIFKLHASQERLSNIKNAFKAPLYIALLSIFLGVLGGFHIIFLRVATLLFTLMSLRIVLHWRKAVDLYQERKRNNVLKTELNKIDLIEKSGYEPAFEDIEEKRKGLYFKSPPSLSKINGQSKSLEPHLKHVPHLEPSTRPSFG